MAATGIDSRRRRLLVMPLLLGIPIAWAGKDGGARLIEVWKGPTCECCNDWVTQESNGFKVRTHDQGNTDARQRLGMPIRYGSCHTASVGGYAIEGHVPAREIQRLLKERPVAVGLAVPAMPVGSPGMDGPAYGQRKDPYDVLLVVRDGNATTYQRY